MKNKSFLFTAFLLLLIINKTKAQQGFSIGVSGAFLYSYKNATPLHSYRFRTNSNYSEKQLSGLQFSIDGLYQFKHNWNISTALSYTNSGYQTIVTGLRFGDRIDDDLGFVNTGGKNTDLIVKYRLTHLSIPILFGYKIALGSKGKHALLLRSGFTNHIVLRYTEKTSTNTYSYAKTRYDFPNQYKTYGISANLNIGYYYRINRHNIGINLLGDYGLEPTNKKVSNRNQHNYFVGAGLSYFYSLSK